MQPIPISTLKTREEKDWGGERLGRRKTGEEKE